jgi:hypothetical protein
MYFVRLNIKNIAWFNFIKTLIGRCSTSELSPQPLKFIFYMFYDELKYIRTLCMYTIYKDVNKHCKYVLIILLILESKVQWHD